MTVLSDRVDALEATNDNLVTLLSGLSATMQAQIAAGRGLVWQGDWETATAYTNVDAVSSGGTSYVCILAHTSGSTTEPGVGASWESYWDVLASSGGEWHVDAGAPASGLGLDGDFYLNTSNGDVYYKSGGAWALQLNIKGPAGADGASGGQWFSGTGVPSSGLGADGDFYLDDANGDVYSKAAGAWTVADNLTGPAGATGDGFTGGSYDVGTGVVTFTSDDGLGFFTSDLRGAAGLDGDGFTGGTYDAGTGIVTFTSDDGLGFSTADLRGAAGADGDGFTGGSYDAGTGVVTFTSDDGLGFTTGDLRGADLDWRGAWVTATAYAVNEAVSNGGSSYVCISSHTSGGTTEPGVGASWQTEWDLMAAKGAAGAGSGDMLAATYDPQAIAGDAFARASHTGAQAISTVTGLQSALDGKAATSHTHTLADVTDAGTAAASAIGDFATAAQGAKADTAQQPPVEGPFVNGDKTKLNGIEAGADVTDTANVTAAGALMDSEVTNLAQVKAFNSAAYAVADGDVLDVTFTPTNYTPDATPAEASDVDDLAAHLKGIDTALGGAGGGGLVFLASTDISSAATVDFTAFDATKYDNYLFTLHSVTPANDGPYFEFRTSSDGGATYDTGTDFYTLEVNSGSSVNYAVGSISNQLGNAAGEEGYTGHIWVYGPHLAKKTILIVEGAGYSTAGLLNASHWFNSRNSSADVDAIRFYMSSGNIASGTITMYGMVNA